MFIIGTNDASIVSTYDSNHDGVPDWEVDYREKIDRMMATFVGGSRHRTVFWLGPPTLGDETLDKGAKAMGPVMREEAKKFAPDVIYVDTYKLFSTPGPDGGYSRSLPDAQGNDVQMRISDGVHFTVDGAQYLSDSGLEVAQPALADHEAGRPVATDRLHDRTRQQLQRAWHRSLPAARELDSFVVVVDHSVVDGDGHECAEGVVDHRRVDQAHDAGDQARHDGAGHATGRHHAGDFSAHITTSEDDEDDEDDTEDTTQDADDVARHVVATAHLARLGPALVACSDARPAAAASAAVELAQSVVDSGARGLAQASSDKGKVSVAKLDQNQALAYDLAHAAAAVEGSRGCAATASTANSRRCLHRYVADAIHDVVHAARGGSVGASSLTARAAMPFVAEHRDPSFLESLADQCTKHGSGPTHLSDDFELVAETFRRFADDKIRPAAEHVHRTNADVPEDIIGGLAELGGFGLSVPEEYGGFATGGESDYMGMVVATESSRAGRSASAARS